MGDGGSARCTEPGLAVYRRGWTSGCRRQSVSPSVQLRAVAALALYRRGRRGDEGRDSLLRVLGDGLEYGSGATSDAEIMDALVSDWADDSELHDACWAGVGRHRSTEIRHRYEMPGQCS